MLACQEGAGGSRVEGEQGERGKGRSVKVSVGKSFLFSFVFGIAFLKARAHDSPGDFCLGICLRHAGADPPPSPSLSPQFTVPQPEAVAELRQAPDSAAPFSQSFVFLCAYLYFAAFAFFSLSIV